MQAFFPVLMKIAACAALIAVGVWLVRVAKRGGKFAYALGAGLMLFGLGNMRDPLNDAVQVAKRPKLREEDDSGAPPNPENLSDGPNGPRNQ